MGEWMSGVFAFAIQVCDWHHLCLGCLRCTQVFQAGVVRSYTLESTYAGSNKMHFSTYEHTTPPPQLEGSTECVNETVNDQHPMHRPLMPLSFHPTFHPGCQTNISGAWAPICACAAEDAGRRTSAAANER